MLRLICSKTLRDGISNEKICEIIGLKKIEEFLREQKLQRFGHMQKLDDEKA